MEHIETSIVKRHTKRTVVVLGYFNHDDLENDLAKWVFDAFFKERFSEYELLFVNPDHLEDLPNHTVAVLVCNSVGNANSASSTSSTSSTSIASSAVTKECLVDKIQKLLKCHSCPIYGIGLGNHGLINRGKVAGASGSDVADIDKYLGFFDYIFTRSTPSLEKCFTSNYIRHYPDISYLLPYYLPEEFSPPIASLADKYGLDISSKCIGVFLSDSIKSDLQEGLAYQKVLHEIGRFLVSISMDGQGCLPCCKKSKFQIYLFSLNRGDQIINHDLYKIIGFLPNIHIVERDIEINDILPLFKKCHTTICTSLQAHMFSCMTMTPMMSLHSDEEVNDLLTRAGLLDYSERFIVDPVSNCVLDIKIQAANLKWSRIMDQRTEYRKLLRKFNEENKSKVSVFLTSLTNLLIYRPHRIRPGTKYFDELVGKNVAKIAERIAYYVVTEKIKSEEGAQSDEDFLLEETKTRIQTFGIRKLYDLLDLMQLENPSVDQEKKFLSEVVSVTLTQKNKSIFSWGLEQQILTPEYDLTESVKWIRTKYYEPGNPDVCSPPYCGFLDNSTDHDLRKLNMSYFDQNSLQGVHRSGWQYVINHVQKYHAPRRGTIFDSYLDKTFGWQAEFNRKIGILPMKKSWIGVLHHTPEESYSENNLSEIFKKDLFIESLPNCKGLIVLSQYIKDWIDIKLKCLGFEGRIPVLKLYHPTKFVEEEDAFSWDKFITNQNKKVIQIGAWLRDIYAIYALPKPNDFVKCALKGKEMDNYFPHHGCLSDVENALIELGLDDQCDGGSDGAICRIANGKRANKYLMGLYQTIKEKEESVKILDYLDEQAYDNLLSENVVFIKLIDVSACNTLIECIVRNTPILVNPLPAVIEYLGPSYPLYYNTLDEATALLNNQKKLKSGHDYLVKKNKDFLNIDTFIETFVKSDLFVGLN